MTFNQPVEQRKVRVQRLAAGRWIVTEELRVTGPQVSVPLRLPLAGVHRLRNPIAEVKVVMIGDRPWVLFQQLGVLMRVP